MSDAAPVSDAVLVITGLGAVSAAGVGLDALRGLLRAGTSALQPRSRAAIGGLDPGWIGEVPDPPDPEATILAPMDALPNPTAQGLCRRWAITAAREALTQAQVPGRIPADRVALILGSNLEDRPAPLDALVHAVAEALGLAGPRLALSMACASSTAGFSLARSLLASGAAQAVLVGGSDVLTPRVIGAFRTLELLADQPCGPFGARVGTSLGEGAGFVVVEAADTSRAPTIAVLGEATSADGHHPTAPEPRGRGLAEAIEAALADAGVAAQEIDLVDAHATGTEANDLAEVRSLTRVFGARVAAGGLPVVASKSLLGHAQGAAGALELITTLLARERGEVPHNPGFVAPPRPGAPGDPLGASRPPARSWTHLLSCNAGFGGSNVAVVLGPPRPRPPLASLPPRPIRIAARVVVEADADGRLPEQDWRRAVRGRDLRSVDRSSQHLTAVVDRALRSLPRRPRRQAAGLVVGLPRSSADAAARMHDQIVERGLEHAAARGFATSLTVIPAGECATALELWGPMLTLCAAGISGLLAVIAAAEQLRRRPTVQAMVAACVDEDPPDRELGSQRPHEGAGAWVLGDEGPLTLLGWGLAGPGRAGQAEALAVAGLEPATVEGLVRITPRATRASALLAEIDAALQTLEIGATALVLADAPTVASCALLLARQS